MRAFVAAGVLLLLAVPGLAASASTAPAPATEPPAVMQPNPAPSSAPAPARPRNTAPAPGSPAILTTPQDPGGRAPIADRLILPGRAPPKPPPPQGGELAGYWTGTWTKFNDALPVALTFEKTPTGYIGRFDSDALQVAGIPFASVAYNEPHVSFTLRGDTTTAVFNGAVSINTISGTFTEGPAHGTFKLERAPTPEAKLRVRDITFTNGNVTLAGTLVMPPIAPRRYRAILLMPGSGPEGRWANRYLAQRFAEHGVAALIYDKRGVGGSTGDWRNSSFSDLVNDAVAGIRFLQAQPGIHPENVGVYGHSQGGTIIPMVAERAGNLEFVIAAAPSGLRPDRVEEYSLNNAMGVALLPAGERLDAQAFAREIVYVAYRGKDRTTLDAMTRQYRGRTWFFEPPPFSDPYWWLSRDIAGYRPVGHWRKVNARILLVFGRYDMRVPTDESLRLIRGAVEGNDRHGVFRYWVIPDADHNFRVVNTGQYGTWPKRVPDFADRLVNWVLWDHGDEGRPEW
jgi:uncharacterized protein